MTPTAITARLLVYMRDLSPERAAELCEIVHQLIETALAAEKLPDVKAMDLVSTILKVAAERQRLELKEKAVPK